MRVLDLDLDYFLSAAAHFVPEGEERLPSDRYQPSAKQEVRDCLENNLGLTKESRIPAVLCVHHDEVLYHCEKLRSDGILEAAFELVHMDSHADMGAGDDSWVEILERACLSERLKQDMNTGYFDRVGLGNYVSYMALLGFLSKLTYVQNPKAFDDDSFAMFLNEDRNIMRIPIWSSEDFVKSKDNFTLRFPEATLYEYEVSDRREPDIPFDRVVGSSYFDSGKFDYAFLAQSPNYTPLESDALIGVIAEYFDFKWGEEYCASDGRFKKARDLYLSLGFN